MTLPAYLLETLVCPKCKQPILYFPRGEADQREEDAFLLCPASRLRFRIADGVANLIVDEAQSLTAPEAARLVARAKELGLVTG